MPHSTSSSTPTHNARRFKLIDEVRPPVSRYQKIKKQVKAGSIGFSLSLSKRAVKKVFGTLFDRHRQTPGLRTLTAVTVFYLLIEFAFSAWLIDVMATQGNEQSIQLAEHYGRLISGFAVALLFWPGRLTIRNPLKRLISLIVCTGSIMTAVYVAERALVDHLVSLSSPQQRSAASVGALLRAGLATGQINDSMLQGFWSEDASNSAVGKAFIGISAFVAASSESARTQTISIAPKVMKGVLDVKMGGVEGEYARYLESQTAIQKKFKTYQEGVKSYKAALAKTDAQAAQAWEQYLDSLDAKHRYWGRHLLKNKRRDGQLVIERAQEPTREAVRKSGIPVPKNWHTADRATFVRLAKQEAVKKVNASFKERFGNMPIDLNLAQFGAREEVQSAWRESIHYPKSIGTLPISKLSKEQFESRIYRSLLASRAQQQLVGYQGKVSDYADGGVKEEEGKQAYKAMIAPFFALSLSLMGAITHFCKSGLLITNLTTGVHLRSGLAKFIFILTVIVSAMVSASVWVKTPLTSHAVYQEWVAFTPKGNENQFHAMHTTLTKGVVDALIKTQSIAYPAFNMIKNQFEPILESKVGGQIKSILVNNVDSH